MLQSLEECMIFLKEIGLATPPDALDHPLVDRLWVANQSGTLIRRVRATRQMWIYTNGEEKNPLAWREFADAVSRKRRADSDYAIAISETELEALYADHIQKVAQSTPKPILRRGGFIEGKPLEYRIQAPYEIEELPRPRKLGSDNNADDIGTYK